MKARSGLIGPVLAIVLGVGMIVAATTLVLVSNVVTNPNTVVPVQVPVTVSIVDIPGGAPNWVPGEVTTNTTYDLQIAWVANGTVTNGVTTIEFDKAGISVTDVTAAWFDGASWSPITLTDNGDALTGQVGPTFSVAKGDVSTYNVQLAYHNLGDFTFKVYVMGVLG